MSERNVTEGEVFTYPGHVLRDGTPITTTIAPKCDTDAGRWQCMTHNLIFANNMEAEGHRSERGEHAIAWHCFNHGPEVP